MKQTLKLPNNVRFEIMDNGYVLISSTGKCTRFDALGNLVSKFNMEDSQWLKYFDYMGQTEHDVVSAWYFKQEPKTEWQQNFLYKVSDALSVINYPYRIANIEPSIDEDGRLYFEEGRPVCIWLSTQQWLEKAFEFAPEYNSELATFEELVLWYAYRIAKGYWTLEEVCDDSSMFGNYTDAPNSTGKIEVSGKRVVGGAKDGTGNTYKITRGISYFKLSGGSFRNSGKERPIAQYTYCVTLEQLHECGTGVIVLKK